MPHAPDRFRPALGPQLGIVGHWAGLRVTEPARTLHHNSFNSSPPHGATRLWTAQHTTAVSQHRVISMVAVSCQAVWSGWWDAHLLHGTSCASYIHRSCCKQHMAWDAVAQMHSNLDGCKRLHAASLIVPDEGTAWGPRKAMDELLSGESLHKHRLEEATKKGRGY